LDQFLGFPDPEIAPFNESRRVGKQGIPVIGTSLVDAGQRRVKVVKIGFHEVEPLTSPLTPPPGPTPHMLRHPRSRVDMLDIEAPPSSPPLAAINRPPTMRIEPLIKESVSGHAVTADHGLTGKGRNGQ